MGSGDPVLKSKSRIGEFIPQGNKKYTLSRPAPAKGFLARLLYAVDQPMKSLDERVTSEKCVTPRVGWVGWGSLVQHTTDI